MDKERVKRYSVLAKAFLIRDGWKRAEYFKKIGYFASQGCGCYFQPYNFGTESHLISFGDNCFIASNTRFITHDVVSLMLRQKTGDSTYQERVGTIKLGNNVFVGSESIILYDVEIGSDVVVGSGSLVTKNLPDGTVCVGRPAKPIGSFYDYQTRLLEWSKSVPWDTANETADVIRRKQTEWFLGDSEKRRFVR